MAKAKQPKQAKQPQFDTLKAAGLESFTVEQIERSALTDAPYNPRVMSDRERHNLKTALRHHGLVAPITWNKRTGHIVGGHQRISIMDSLMGHAQYSLSVAVVDVAIADEKAMNLLLNNAAAGGSWELEKLKAMFADEDMKLAATGFNDSDLIAMFGDGAFNERSEDLAQLAQKLSDISAHYTAVQKRNAAKATSESYLVFVFPDGAHCDDFVQQCGLPDNRYQNGVWLMEALRLRRSESGDTKSPAEVSPPA